MDEKRTVVAVRRVPRERLRRVQPLPVHQRLEPLQRLRQQHPRAFHRLAGGERHGVVCPAGRDDSVLIGDVLDLEVRKPRFFHGGEVGRVGLGHGERLRLAAAHDGVAGGLEPRDQLGVEAGVAQRGLGVGAALQLQLVGVEEFLVMREKEKRRNRFGEVELGGTHVEGFGEAAVALDDAALAVALQTAAAEVREHLRVVAHADEALLQLRAAPAGAAHLHVEHARHRGARRARVARRLAGVLAELALLAADLPAAALQHVVGRAGRLVAEPLAEVPAGERLAADAVAEDLLAVAGHALDDPVPADAHAVGGDRAGRAGPEVAGMAPIVPVRTELRARLVAHRRLRPAPHRRRDHLLPAGARDRLHAHVAAGDAGAGVAGQVAGVLPAVEQLPADARTDVEGPVGALAAVRAAERLAAVPPAVQLGLADALADERRAQRLLLLGRNAQRRGAVVQRPAGDRALDEAAAAGLRAGRLAGGAGARVALPRTGVQAAGQRLAADLATAREGVRAAGPGRIDLQREVLAAGAARRGRDRVGTGTAVERVAELIAAVALALQHLPAHLAAAVAADPRFAHRQQSERLHARRRRVHSDFHVSLILRLLILLLSFFVFSLVLFVLFFIAEIAEIAEAVQIAQHVRVVQRRADGSLRGGRHRGDHQLGPIVRIARADRHARLSAGHRRAMLPAVAATLHAHRARRTRPRVASQRARVLLAVQQLPADLIAVHGRRIHAAAHRLLRLAALAGQLDGGRAGMAGSRMAGIRARMNARASAAPTADLAAAVRQQRAVGVAGVRRVARPRVEHASAAVAAGENGGDLLVAAAEGAARLHDLDALAVEIAERLERIARLARNGLERGLVEVLHDPLLHAVHMQHHVARRTRPDQLLLLDRLHADRAGVPLMRQLLLQAVA